MYFMTQSGSVYEVDTENKRVRRTAGQVNQKSRINGEWLIYRDVTPVKLNQEVIFMWGEPGQILPEAERATMTSIVIGVQQ